MALDIATPCPPAFNATLPLMIIRMLLHSIDFSCHTSLWSLTIWTILTQEPIWKFISWCYFWYNYHVYVRKQHIRIIQGESHKEMIYQPRVKGNYEGEYSTWSWWQKCTTPGLKGEVERKVNRTQREKILREPPWLRGTTIPWGKSGISSIAPISHQGSPVAGPSGKPAGWETPEGREQCVRCWEMNGETHQLIWRVSRMFVFSILFVEIENHIIWWGFLRLELRNRSAHGRRLQELWEAHFLIPHTFQKSDFCRHLSCLVRSQE